MGKVLVSACLAGRNCRYDGGNCRATALGIGDHEAVLFCPEEAGGLPTPRLPAEIVGGDGADVLAGLAQVVTASGEDVTAAYLAGARQALSLCQREGIERALLKRRSPSCGASAVYDGTFSHTLRPGQGVTAALLSRHGVQVEEL